LIGLIGRLCVDRFCHRPRNHLRHHGISHKRSNQRGEQSCHPRFAEKISARPKPRDCNCPSLPRDNDSSILDPARSWRFPRRWSSSPVLCMASHFSDHSRREHSQTVEERISTGDAIIGEALRGACYAVTIRIANK